MSDLTTTGLGQHISSRFNEDLERIRASVLEMGGLVERALAQALASIRQAESRAALRVAQEEARVNELERLIDADCSRVLATRSPTASDLRLVVATLKTITDLERIGDEASKIARYAVKVYESDRMVMPRYNEIKYMSGLAIKMLRESLDAFARLDVSGAANVARQDMEVDEEFHLITRHLITYMMEDPRTISTFIDLLFVVKAIERIGDHAKNMSEYVVFMVRGKDVRHTSIEELEREIQ